MDVAKRSRPQKGRSINPREQTITISTEAARPVHFVSVIPCSRPIPALRVASSSDVLSRGGGAVHVIPESDLRPMRLITR